jgi:hypothetical protein
MIPHEMFSGQRMVGMAYGIAFVAGTLISRLIQDVNKLSP